MYALAGELFPLCRSITGEGTRVTLRRLQAELPLMKLYEVPTGTKVFDWTIPKEWNIRGGTIDYEDGTRILDFSDTNLHIMGYSLPVNKWVELGELQKYIYSDPSQPDWIPYVTSYYKERFGFCMKHSQRMALKPGRYHMVIDSELKDGSMTYGEILLQGECTQEVFLSTYICHPSMANNELSGPCLTIALAKWLNERIKCRYTYRIVFLPETIGSITYLAKNLDAMKKNIIAGYNISCVGDDRSYSYLASRDGNTLADRTVKNMLGNMHPDYKSYSYLSRGSDERQYNAPGIDLPVCSVMRTKYGEYPEYHTSADDLSLISPEGFQGMYETYTAILTALENNYTYKVTCLGEPQLGKRNLYPTESYKGSANAAKVMMDFIAYADGKKDLIAISDIIGAPVSELMLIAQKLNEAGLVKIIN
jgi:aminopeptidase-like protein